MYELRVKTDFAAAHHLEGYPGDCARPHGHNWVIEVFARAKGLDSIGIAYDFRQLKSALKEIVSAWDHQDLNQLRDFAEVNPSAEIMAKMIHDRLAQGLNSQKFWIHQVTVWENDRCSASYFADAEEEGCCGGGGCC